MGDERQAGMRLDLGGKLKNSSLAPYRALWPLFDAIINSIHAIEDRHRQDGRIKVLVNRDHSKPSQKQIEGGYEVAEVQGFEITDNGIGFNDANYQSFETSDSQLKAARGSKGLGRFLWLKAYRDDVLIESTFRDAAGAFQKRTFRFNRAKGPTDDQVVADAAATDTGTTVRLRNMEQVYRDQVPRHLTTLASRIIDHCLNYLFRADCPLIVLSDDGGNAVTVNEEFQKRGYAGTPPEVIDVKGNALSVQHLHVRASGAKHTVHYQGNDREVISEDILLPDLERRIPNPADGTTFALVTLVKGALLDSSVNPERTAFTLPTAAELQMGDSTPTIEDVKAGVRSAIERHLEPFLAPARERKMAVIRAFVETQAPQYRPVLRRNLEDVQRIPAGLTPEKLDLELHALKAKAEMETKRDVATLLGDPNLQGYDSTFKDLVAQVSEQSKASLVDHVVKRRVVLEILSRRLERRREDGRYEAEEEIHKIIFPLRTTSDDVEFEQQNLWIIDEKLTFHQYLASDKALSTTDPSRPDIVIWNKAFALSDEPDAAQPLNSVTILEFKKPVRNDYAQGDLEDDKKNPIAQVLGYVQAIREGRAQDQDGRPLIVAQGAPFYAYILADLTPRFRELALYNGFKLSPDGMGFYDFREHFKAWVEILSYQKIIADAKKRNRALFEALHLPANIGLPPKPPGSDSER